MISRKRKWGTREARTMQDRRALKCFRAQHTVFGFFVAVET